MVKLAVFLGNAGRQYEKTRHNAAFLLASRLFPDAVYSVKFHSAYTKVGQVHVLKPLTLMNRSGIAVGEAASFFHFKRDEILIVHDDLELPLGEARVQKGGGLKGHNGLRSIKDSLGGDDFLRLRIGIGRPQHGDVALYVLSPFREAEMASLNALFDSLAREDIFTLQPGFCHKD